MLIKPIHSLFGIDTEQKRDIAVVGIPFDSTQSLFSGSKFAPTLIRMASQMLDEYSFYLRKDIRELSISDWGDVEVSYGDFFETRRRVLDAIEHIGAKKYLFLGGDHSISMITVESLKDEIGIYVHVDADADFEEEYYGNKFSHDCTLRRIGEMIGFDKIILLGYRSASPKELKDLEDLGVEAYTTIDIMEDESILKNVFKKADYLSLDLDVFDPAYAPDVGTPEPLGLLPQQFYRYIKYLSPKFVDIVELVTNKINSITAILAASLARDIAIMMAGK